LGKILSICWGQCWWSCN